jgi:hypothetical protein
MYGQTRNATAFAVLRMNNTNNKHMLVLSWEKPDQLRELLFQDQAGDKLLRRFEDLSGLGFMVPDPQSAFKLAGLPQAPQGAQKNMKQ